MRKVIVNTTPVIALAKAGELELLHKIYKEICIPEAVFNEIKGEPAKSLVAGSSWIKVVSVKNNESKKLYSSRLHAGEIEVMMLAKEQSADLLIIDDNAAKKTAKFLGFAVTGTLGVIIKAKEEGYIGSVKPLIEELIRDGFYISEKILDYVLKSADEL